MMHVEFNWVRDPKRQFKLRTVRGTPVITIGGLKEMRSFTSYSPLQPAPYRSRRSAPAREILLAFAKVDTPLDALEFVNDHGPLTALGRSIKGEPVALILKEARAMQEVLAAVAEHDEEYLAEYIYNYDFGRLAVEVDPGGAMTQMNLRVPDLLGALKFMLAEKLSSGAVYRRCPHCNNLFDVGEGTGRTMKAIYCSPAHQIQNKRSEGK